MDFCAVVSLLTTVADPILAAALVAFTIVLALATKALAKETRRMREIQETPRLSIRIEGRDDGRNFWTLHFETRGKV